MSMKTKQETILTALVESGLQGLNTEEAINLGSTCLHTDIATLGKLGLVISRKWETLPRKRGGTKRYKRYWLTYENCRKAKKIIKLWKVKRKIKD